MAVHRYGFPLCPLMVDKFHKAVRLLEARRAKIWDRQVQIRNAKFGKCVKWQARLIERNQGSDAVI
jgi:hypothetical protein